MSHNVTACTSYCQDPQKIEMVANFSWVRLFQITEVIWQNRGLVADQLNNTLSKSQAEEDGKLTKKA